MLQSTYCFCFHSFIKAKSSISGLYICQRNDIFWNSESRRIYSILIEQYNWSIKNKAQNSRMYVLSESIKSKLSNLKTKVYRGS